MGKYIKLIVIIMTLSLIAGVIDYFLGIKIEVFSYGIIHKVMYMTMGIIIAGLKEIIT